MVNAAIELYDEEILQLYVIRIPVGNFPNNTYLIKCDIRLSSMHNLFVNFTASWYYLYFCAY